MTESQDAATDLVAQMQNGFAEWQSWVQRTMQQFQEATQFEQQVATGFADWQQRWLQIINDYEQKAKPIVDEMLQALQKLAAATPEPLEPWAQAAVSLTEQSIRAQEEYLSRLAESGGGPGTPK